MKRAVRSLTDRIRGFVDAFTPRPAKHRRTAALARMLRPVHCGRPLIRLGGDHDGGYLVPDDLEGIEYCFSPGVAEQVAFEVDCLDRGIQSFLADGSIEGPPAALAACDFLPLFLGDRNSRTTVTLDAWVRRSLGSDDEGDLLLQMDIEGAEFKTLLAASDATLQRFRILVVEFHHAQRLRRHAYYAQWRACVERLTASFDVVHVHPNTAAGLVTVHGFPFPRALEVTFLRKDRVLERTPVTELPHPLDAPTFAGGPDLPLPQAWLEPHASETA